MTTERLAECAKLARETRVAGDTEIGLKPPSAYELGEMVEELVAALRASAASARAADAEVKRLRAEVDRLRAPSPWKVDTRCLCEECGRHFGEPHQCYCPLAGEDPREEDPDDGSAL